MSYSPTVNHHTQKKKALKGLFTERLSSTYKHLTLENTLLPYIQRLYTVKKDFKVFAISTQFPQSV